MDQRITLVTLGVADLARARAFYERLGWQRSFKAAEGVAFFQTGGMSLALWPLTDLAADAHVPAARSGFAGMSLACNVRSRAEVDATLAEAAAAGGRVLRAAHDTPWGGYSGYFADLDGFAWEIAWNPDFPIAADGSIRLPG